MTGAASALDGMQAIALDVRRHGDAPGAGTASLAGDRALPCAIILMSARLEEFNAIAAWALGRAWEAPR